MNPERTERRREFIINTIYFAIIALILFACFKYVAKWVMPFIIGFVIALMVQPAALGLSKLTRLNRKLSGILVLILAYALVIFVVWIVGAKIVGSLQDLFTKLPTYYDRSILPFLNNIIAMFENLAARISPQTLNQIYEMIENASDTIRNYIIRFSSGMLTGIAGITTRIPFYFISFIFTILASVFISMDYKNIVSFIKRQFSPKTREVLGDAKRHIGKTALGYLRAYAIIWIMTFTELSIGLSFLKVENAIGIAALIAIADILPVLGTGTVVIPWAIFSLFTRNYFLAIGLAVLYIVVMVVRNFAEPKIVGDQLGLHPLATLIAIYLGYLLMGVFGMIILPVVTNIIAGLHRMGKIKIWND